MHESAEHNNTLSLSLSLSHLKGEDDWNVVIRECGSLASKWISISGLLGLRKYDIDNIAVNYHANCYSCWNAALIHWIRQNYSTKKYGLPSWRTLLRTVAMVDRRLFKELVSKHKVCNYL